VTPETSPSIITVRYSRATSISMTAAGGAMLLAWAAYAIVDDNPFWPLFILGAFFLYTGVNSFFRPFCQYDTASGALVFPAIIGVGKQVLGGPIREQLHYDGKRLVRLGLGGSRRPVNPWTSNRQDMARLIEAVATPASEDRWKRRERRRG
jgi:hypothetical protein